MITIRAETLTDRAAIDAIHAASFPTSAEADLVAALRDSGDLVTSLVATVEGALVGHVAFSPVSVAGADVSATGLAPVAVLPSFRRRGVGAALVAAGLEARRAAGDAGVVVLGDPAYYGRFGFVAARTFGLTDPYGGGDAFQLLGHGPLPTGAVRYAPAFDALPEGPPSSFAEPLAAIYAVGEDGAFGAAGGLPWDWPADREHFERATRGRAVVMGRGTFDETGEPLAGRVNVVVSRTMARRPGVEIARTLKEGITIARRFDSMPLVIGGAALLAQAWPLVTRAYVTTIPRSPGGDVFFRPDRSALVSAARWVDDEGARYEILARRPPP